MRRCRVHRAVRHRRLGPESPAGPANGVDGQRPFAGPVRRRTIDRQRDIVGCLPQLGYVADDDRVGDALFVAANVAFGSG